MFSSNQSFTRSINNSFTSIRDLEASIFIRRLLVSVRSVSNIRQHAERSIYYLQNLQFPDMLIPDEFFLQYTLH